MSAYTQKLRAALAAEPIDVARTAVIRLIRKAARRRIYDYAAANCIMDYADPLLVEQVHRDFRAQTITAATALVATTEAATRIADLGPVFDTIEPWLE